MACACEKERQQETKQRYLLEFTSLPNQYQEWTFESLSDRNNEQQEARAAAWEFARGEATYKWLVLVGGYGLGKSYLGAAVLNWRRMHQEAHLPLGRYANTVDMLAWLRDGFKDDSTEARFQGYLDVGLLFLDDLGAQHGTLWAWEQIYRLLDTRSREQLETIIATNTPIKSIPGRIADRLLDTNTGLVKTVELKGNSLRSGRQWA